jgi:hypothetical protein
MRRFQIVCRATSTFLICLTAMLVVSSTTHAQTSSKAQKPKPKWLRLEGEGPFNKVVTVRIENEGKVYYGRPLGQDLKKLAVLRWDGRITLLPRQERMEIFSPGFAPYSQDELAKRLQKQFGPRYLTQSSEHFTVVYPRTNQKKWAAKYESVYNQFKSYLARHRIDVAEPRFPMVVVVLASRNEFDRSLANEIIFKKNVFGYYSRISNRVTTFVSSDPRIARKVDRIANLTVVHEAVHQVAFNTGVHNRLCAVPRWMSEGFAMLYESKGFRNSKPDQPVDERVNVRRLVQLKKMFATGQVTGNIEMMLRNDRIFETDPDLAYSLAWGLSFYLAEKETEKYLRFVIKDGNTNEFMNYTPNQRVEFFVETFVVDFDKLERKLKKFIMNLPT